MPTTKQLAQSMLDMLETHKRDNGAEFLTFKEDRPQWMQDVSFAAHGDMMPDDHRYRFIFEALAAMVEYDDPADAIESIEADIYTSDLTTWLGSRADRYGYCDEYMEEMGKESFPGTIELLQAGQAREKEEVFNLVLDALRDLESDDDADDEESVA